VEYEIVIGLEVHAQLLTKSKMFCSCSADYANTPPNTHVCPVCLGMPGVLPTINKKAVEYSVMTAIALHCTIAKWAKFDRKNYPYPDLMKGYQISQFDAPMGTKGWLNLDIDGQRKKIGVTRVHLEEDVAKLMHRVSPEGESYSLMDVNRAGVPLMEIVGEPDLSSPEEARLYLIKLRTILQYLGVSTGNMEEGSFRCDANVSIRPKGTKELLGKVEVKNMNSFKAVYKALEFEAKRQQEVMENNGRVVQETRGWVEEKGMTVSQRSKEYAHDYRYFPEPDLPPFTFEQSWVDELSQKLPELPEAKRDRFMSEFGLPLYDADLLVESKVTASYFESCVKKLANMAPPEINKKAKKIANWILSDFSRLLNASNISIDAAKITPQNLVDLVDLIDKGTISGPVAKSVFEEMFNSGKMAKDIIVEKGLIQISDNSELEGMADEVIKNNTQAVLDFKAGKQQTLGFLVGQIMKSSKGRANPEMVKKILLQKLGGS
jgi:aspartyl-tRNA(Asn)/glutamyl-tRNA(Gln) amidotransferase subunit B